MRRALILIAAMGLCLTVNHCALGGSTSSGINSFEANGVSPILSGMNFGEMNDDPEKVRKIVERMTEQGLVSEVNDLEKIHEIVERIKEQGRISIPDSFALDHRTTKLIRGKILGLRADQRQLLVKKTIGEAEYSSLEGFFIKQLGSTDREQRNLALESLGYPLFSMGAVDQLKPFVFTTDKTTQFTAVRSLVYLDVEGASSLLHDIILAGVLGDPLLYTAIDALYISNDKGLDSLSMILVANNPGGATFKSLLPVLKKREDYRQIVASLFKKNVFYVSWEKQKLTPQDMAQVNAEYQLIQEILSNPSSFITDEAIKQKVMLYASKSPLFQLYGTALMILEKSGQDLIYFTDMLKSSSLTSQKKKLLEQIVSRIQSGQRRK